MTCECARLWQVAVQEQTVAWWRDASELKLRAPRGSSFIPGPFVAPAANIFVILSAAVRRI
jgi:hypothetical protein